MANVTKTKKKETLDVRLHWPLLPVASGKSCAIVALHESGVGAVEDL
ncbi:hypothetical protein ACP70R_007791 [Stipagrostis hirtigluma subsp. patula]